MAFATPSPSQIVSAAPTSVIKSDVTPENYTWARPQISSWIVWLVAFLYLVTGIFTRVFSKWQNRTMLPVSAEALVDSNFNQPFWQSLIMFVGMAICLPAFWLDRYFAKKRSNGERLHGYCEFPKQNDLERSNTKSWLQFLPAVLDLGGSVTGNIASTITLISVVQMLSNSSMIMTTLFSLFMLRRPVRVHEWFGIAIMTFGMLASSYSAIIYPDQSSAFDAKWAWVGILLTIVGQVSHSAKVVVEEKIMEKGYCPPLYAVGWQGIWGIVVNVVLLIIIQYANWYKITEGFYQMSISGELVLANVLYLIFTFLYNGIALMVTAVADSVFRTVVSGLRSPIIFLVELVLDWADWNWEAFLGLVFSVIGFFMYSYIFGLNKHNAPRAHRFFRRGCGFGGFPETDDEDEEDVVVVEKRDNNPVVVVDLEKGTANAVSEF